MPVLAMPCYTALQETTESTLLRGIWERMLAEETEHLIKKGARLGRKAHRVFLEGAALVVWREHLPVFRAAGCGSGASPHSL